ncbi:MAG TPA: YdcF family protein [Chthonomonadaceae bacterium]|nr:YdcF family protein [Chthonomonadaceae bacterium]
MAEGLILGGFLGLCVSTLGISELLHQRIQENVLLLPALLGVAIAVTPARALLRGGALAAFALMALIGYTPIMNRLVPSLVRSDPLQHVPAVVVISTALHKDGALNAAGQERFLHGYLLLRQGWGDTLVLTRAIPKIGDQSPVVMDQMRTLGLQYPVERVGPVVNTHDEAVDVARLAKSRGWKRVILVTHPWHMRRARAVFEKAGLEVLCSPCVEGSYDMSDLTSPRGRYAACNNWLHETIGYQVYRLRGWL